MPTHITRATTKGALTPKGTRAQDIALSLMGAGRFEALSVAQTASWDRTDTATLVGRDAIQTVADTLPEPTSVVVSEVVTHGRAGTVSGHVTRDGDGVYLFCHVLRFTSAAAREVAQMVSFERKDPRHG